MVHWSGASKIIHTKILACLALNLMVLVYVYCFCLWQLRWLLQSIQTNYPAMFYDNVIHVHTHKKIAFTTVPIFLVEGELVDQVATPIGHA
jgi:hypothetical protein